MTKHHKIMQTPIYESFSMLHPDGTLMCKCNEKKAQWYVKRDLANWIDSKTFQLKFEPQGHGKSDNIYYIQEMENKCVVCGSEEELNKHHVVPYVFRSRFPIEYKESNHHDIVATCVCCHEAYETHATLYKQQLAEQCGVSMNSGMTKEQSMNKKIMSARSVLQKLENGIVDRKSGKPMVIPAIKLEQLKKKASETLIADITENGSVWADKIVDKILKEGTIFEFIKNWRQHFITHANPKNLPEHWSIDHELEIMNKSKHRTKQG